MSVYIITIGALSYVALARSSCAALCDALARHGQRAISVRPVRPVRTGGAA